MGSARRPQPEYLPAKLLKIRELLGLTQEQMAARLSHIKSPLHPGQVSRFEQGKREPSLLLLLKYARIAGVSIDVLVDDELDLPKRLLASPDYEGLGYKRASRDRSRAK
jgi:transcriptional regulator with XRE-family HTH domain